MNLESQRMARRRFILIIVSGTEVNLTPQTAKLIKI